MGKYNKILGIPADTKAKAKEFLSRLAGFRLSLSSHAEEALRDERDIDGIKQNLYDYHPAYQDVFEIVEYGQIEKIGFRIPFNIRDIVFVINSWGKIVTIWTNDKEDNHSTLNKNLYAMA
jgi:hypothetical protein